MPAMLRRALRATFMAAAFATAADALAAGPVELPGGHDHPLVSRFKGSVLENAASESFASLRVPSGPGHRDRDGKLVLDKVIAAEGRVGSYYYVAPQASTPLEVFRSYQAALQQAGFESVYACEEQACDRGIYPEALRRELLAPRPWAGSRPDPAGGSSPRALRYLAARGKSGGNDVVVVVWVTEATSVWSAPTATLLVVESTPMAAGSVTASLQQMQEGLKAEGRIALYGLQFDTGKAEIKAGSRPQLE